MTATLRARRLLIRVGVPVLAATLLAGVGGFAGWQRARGGPAAAATSSFPYTLTLGQLSRDGNVLAPVNQQGFTTAVLASASRDVVRLAVTVSAATAGAFVVDIEIYGPSGGRLDQQWFDNEPFTASQTRAFAVEWRPAPAAPPGGYTVKVGVFRPGPDWQVLYHWNDQAAVFSLP